MISEAIPGELFASYFIKLRLLRIRDLALGTDEWFLRAGDKTLFRIITGCDASSTDLIFQDFRPGTSGMTALSQPAIPLLNFLGPFHDVNLRWGP